MQNIIQLFYTGVDMSNDLFDKAIAKQLDEHRDCKEQHIDVLYDPMVLQPKNGYESCSITVIICHRIVVPNVRQTYKGRFSPRAKRYNDDQVVLKKSIEHEVGMMNLINQDVPFVMLDKEWDLQVLMGFYMHREGRLNNIKVIDIDNLQKAIGDALQGQIFYNDNKINRVYAYKQENDFNYTFINVIGSKKL